MTRRAIHRAGPGRHVGGARAAAAGFTLVEALFALVLLAFAALGAASAEAWNARATALAEAREDAATAAELVLDSLVHVPGTPPTSSATRVQAIELDWTVSGRSGGGADIRLRARTRGPAPLADSFGAIWAPPPTMPDGNP